MPGPLIVITAHAIERWRERVDPRAAEPEIRALLSGRPIACAATFGARVVRIAGHRVILEHEADVTTVITVIPFNEFIPRQLRPEEQGGPLPIAHLRALFAQAEGA